MPVLPKLLTRLQRLYATIDTNPHGLVFHHDDGRPISAEEDRKHWAALLETAEVPHRSIHCARHTTATMLDAAGLDESHRMKALGHSSAVAHRGYIHADHTPTRAAMGAIYELMP